MGGPRRCTRDDTMALHQPLARRKLYDEAVSGFAVGNTFARSLLTASESEALRRQTQGTPAATGSAAESGNPLRLLYVGVGDIRNPLTTLAELGPPGVGAGGAISLHLNDASPLALARCAVLLSLATATGEGAEATEAAEAATLSAAVGSVTAVWSDARLTEATHASLVSVLAQLCGGAAPAGAKAGGGWSLPVPSMPWVAASTTATATALRRYWQGWLDLATTGSAVQLDAVRDAAIAMPGRYANM